MYKYSWDFAIYQILQKFEVNARLTYYLFKVGYCVSWRGPFCHSCSFDVHVFLIQGAVHLLKLCCLSCILLFTTVHCQTCDLHSQFFNFSVCLSDFSPCFFDLILHNKHEDICFHIYLCFIKTYVYSLVVVLRLVFCQSTSELSAFFHPLEVTCRKRFCHHFSVFRLNSKIKWELDKTTLVKRDMVIFIKIIRDQPLSLTVPVNTPSFRLFFSHPCRFRISFPLAGFLAIKHVKFYTDDSIKIES